MTLQEQFRMQCDHAQIVSAFNSDPVAVVIRKWPGQRAAISVFGSSISWGAVTLWKEQSGLRFRVLRRFKHGEAL